MWGVGSMDDKSGQLYPGSTGPRLLSARLGRGLPLSSQHHLTYGGDTCVSSAPGPRLTFPPVLVFTVEASCRLWAVCLLRNKRPCFSQLPAALR